VDRQRAERKVRHKEKEITKRDQNDNHIKRHKAVERNVSSNKDSSPSPPWSGDDPSAKVDWSGISGLPLPSPRWAAEVSSSRQLVQCTREKGAGSSSRPSARPAPEHQRVTHSQAAPSGSGAFMGRRDPLGQDGPPK
jgi:hypothetical protein